MGKKEIMAPTKTDISAVLESHGISIQKMSWFTGVSRGGISSYIKGSARQEVADKIEQFIEHLEDGIDLDEVLRTSRPITAATRIVVDTGLRRGQSVKEIARESLRPVKDILEIADKLRRENKDRYPMRPEPQPREPSPKKRASPKQKQKSPLKQKKRGEKGRLQSGVRGVFFDTDAGRWKALIQQKGRTYYLYSGPDREDAIGLRFKAEKMQRRGLLDSWYVDHKKCKKKEV